MRCGRILSSVLVVLSLLSSRPSKNQEHGRPSLSGQRTTWSPLKLQDKSFAAKNAVVQVTRTLSFGNLRTTHCTRNNCKGLTANDPLSPWPPWNAASGEETIWNIGISYNSTSNTFLSHNGLPLCDKSVTVKVKRGKSRIKYYSNTVATHQLLLIAGDIHENPGPSSTSSSASGSTHNGPRKQTSIRVLAAVCPQCDKPVRRNHKCFQCCVCQDRHHTRCTGTSMNLKLSSKDTPPEVWTCSRCLLSVLPNNPTLNE